MSELDVSGDLGLKVKDGPSSRDLSVEDFKAAATGGATEDTLSAVLAALTDGDEAALVAAVNAVTAAINAAEGNRNSGDDTLRGIIATASNQDAGNTLLTSILAALTDGDEATSLAKLEAIRALLAATLTISGTVSVSNFPATQPVSGSVNVGNFPASTEIANDVGNPVPVSGNVGIGGNVAVIDTDPGQRTQFESYLPTDSSTYQIRFIGSAPQGTADNGAWLVKRLTWTHLDDGDHITDLQTLNGAWSDRATLNWS